METVLRGAAEEVRIGLRLPTVMIGERINRPGVRCLARSFRRAI